MTDTPLPPPPDEKPLQHYPQAPGFPESAANDEPPPTAPRELTWASRLLYLAAALSAIALVFTIGGRDEIRDTFAEDNPDRSADEIDSLVNVFIGVTSAVYLVFIVLYVLLARKILQGAGWARITATVILGIGLLFSAGAAIGGDILSLAFAAISITILVFLWRRPSSEFFAQMKGPSKRQ